MMESTHDAAALLAEQRRRWGQGERVLVEELLRTCPGSVSDDEVLDLVYQEILLREQRDETPRPNEYLRRFPHLEEALRLQFEVHQGLQPDPDESTGPMGENGSQGNDNDLPTIPGYEVCGKLGRGGMGVVYQARHLRLKRPVALKLMRDWAHAEPAELARFRTEAEAMARLQHPNMVQIFEIAEHEGCPYLALEYAAGGSLDEKINGTPQPPREAAELMQTLARAMHYAHERGIVHRDLKPANILLANGARTAPVNTDLAGESPPVAHFVPKITDFGLAKRFRGETAQTASHAILGTPSYMAPEQAGGGSQTVGPAADVYSLGAILYELLTGRPPFRAQTPWDTIAQVLADDPVAPTRLQPKVPRDLETICLRCLAKKPEKRYASALDLADDLNRFLTGRPIHARPVGPVTRLAKWARRNPWPAAAWVAAPLFVLGLFLWQRAENLRVQEKQARQHAAEQQRARGKQALVAAEELAASQMTGGRFKDAAATLDSALQALHDLPDLADDRGRVEARCDRVRRLAECQERFDRSSDAAWSMSGEERGEDTRIECQRALNSFGALDSADWWQRGPAADLNEVQRRQVQREVYRLLLLLTATHIQQGMQDFGTQGPVALKKASGEGLRAVQRAREMERVGVAAESRSADILERGSRQLPDMPSKLFSRPWSLLGSSPADGRALADLNNDADFFFLGSMHVFLGKHKNDFFARAVRAMGPAEFDYGTPLATAERLLRRAAQSEPPHYWSWFMLGRALSANHDYRGAELAFSSCVAMRGDYSRGYEQRALALVQQLPTAAPEQRVSLRRRAEADLAEALRLAPDDASTFWVRGEVFRMLGKPPEALRAYARALELEKDLLRKASRRNLLDTADELARQVLEQDAHDVDAQTLGAWSHLTRGRYEEASEAAQQALSRCPHHPPALAACARLGR